MAQPDKPSDAPSLEDLVHKTDEPERSAHPSMFRFGLNDQNYLQGAHVTPTWRHKLYWFLRKLIDWIHP